MKQTNKQTNKQNGLRLAFDGHLQGRCWYGWPKFPSARSTTTKAESVALHNGDMYVCDHTTSWVGTGEEGGGGAKMKEHVALGINVSAFEVTLYVVRCGLMSELSKKGYRSHSFEQTIFLTWTQMSVHADPVHRVPEDRPISLPWIALLVIVSFVLSTSTGAPNWAPARFSPALIGACFHRWRRAGWRVVPLGQALARDGNRIPKA